MLACTEMITMCLQSAKHEHFRKQQELDHNQNQGISLVQDIFRRADKNDDGKLSLEEFQSYFTDGILTDEQMQELYYSIDRQKTDNLDIDKLSAYFTPHLGEYVNVLSALEKLNVAILKAMDKTKEEYQGSSVLGQFVTRFLLRETSTQLQSLQSSLDCAMEAVHDQGCTGKRTVKKPEDLPIQRVAKRPGRRIQKNMCLSPTDPYSGMLTTGVSVEPDNHWGSQINQLEQLMDKLECESPHLEPLKEDTLAGTYKSNILLVQRQMSVKERDVEQFQQALKIYTDATCSQLNNLHMSVQNLPDRSCFIMYEFWQDRLSWMSYLQSSISKTFQRCIIDSLEEPEMVSTMLLPGGMRFIFERLGGVLPDVSIPSDEESEDEDWDWVGIPGGLDALFAPFFGPLSSDEEEEETEDEEMDEEEDQDPEDEDAWGDKEEDSEDSGDWSTSEHEEDSEDDPEDPLIQLFPPADFWFGWQQQDPPAHAPPPPPEDLPSGSAPSTSSLSVSTKRTKEEDDTDQVSMKRQRRTSKEDSDSD